MRNPFRSGPGHCVSDIVLVTGFSKCSIDSWLDPGVSSALDESEGRSLRTGASEPLFEKKAVCSSFPSLSKRESKRAKSSTEVESTGVITRGSFDSLRGEDLRARLGCLGAAPLERFRFKGLDC